MFSLNIKTYHSCSKTVMHRAKMGSAGSLFNGNFNNIESVISQLFFNGFAQSKH